jgi:hypothetical protein
MAEAGKQWIMKMPKATMVHLAGTDVIHVICM